MKNHQKKATQRSAAAYEKLLNQQTILFNQATQAASPGAQQTERTYFLFFLYCAQHGIAAADAVEHIATENVSVHPLLVGDLCQQAYKLNLLGKV